MWNDRGKWLVVTSSCPLILQMARCGSWQAVVITCKTCFTSVNDPDIISGWPMLVIQMHCESRSDVYVYKCRLNFLEAIRIWGAHHVYPDEVIRMVFSQMRMCATRHQEMCATCYQGEGSLQPSWQGGGVLGHASHAAWLLRKPAPHSKNKPPALPGFEKKPMVQEGSTITLIEK